MKLLSRYATACDVKIGEQHFEEKFFPLPFTKYITLHASSGMSGKNYPYYAEVIHLIKPYLATKGIEIIQLGIKDEPVIPGCHSIVGQTDANQANYVLSRALLHFGNDSFWCHRAGYLKIPLVELFGTTSVENHSPYHFNQDKSIFLSAHRWGRNPSFAAQEQPQSISTIDPFLVARSVLKLLEIPNELYNQTVFIGPAYTGAVLDHIPNATLNSGFNPGLPTAVRMDLCHNEEILVQVLQSGRKINIITKSPINLNILAALKDGILAYNHEINLDCPIDYIKQVKKLLPNVKFFSRTKNEDELSALRFKFFDIVNVEQIINKSRADFEQSYKNYLNDNSFSLDSDDKLSKLKFRTNKFVLSRSKIFLSIAHEKADVPVVDGQPIANIIDNEDFWGDQNHMWVYL